MFIKVLIFQVHEESIALTKQTQNKSKSKV